jgi:hypothetical protein
MGGVESYEVFIRLREGEVYSRVCPRSRAEVRSVAQPAGSHILNDLRAGPDSACSLVQQTRAWRRYRRVRSACMGRLRFGAYHA